MVVLLGGKGVLVHGGLGGAELVATHDTQHNDTQHNDTQHNDIQHKGIQHNNK